MRPMDPAGTAVAAIEILPEPSEWIINYLNLLFPLLAMATYIIRYERQPCIGAGVCVAVDEKNFQMNKDGKADLIGGADKNQTGIWEKEIDESQLEAAKAGAEGCPVIVIKIFNKETGQQVSPWATDVLINLCIDNA